MKALSIASDYVALIGAGEKKIECRTWQTAHRGELLICSNRDRIPGTIPGHALHIVRIVDVRPFKRADIELACMRPTDYANGLWAWLFEYVCPVMPIAVRGKPGLFEVPDDQIQRIDESKLTDQEIDALINNVFIPLTVA